MKSLLRISLLLLLPFFAKAQNKSSPTNLPATNTYAVIVGIKQYQIPAIPGLDYADKDADLFAAYLKSAAGGSVPEENIKLFTNDEATIAAIYNAMDWLKAQAKKDDIVYFYFSGHGDVEIDSAKISHGYLLAFNSPANNYANNAIEVDDINNDALELTTKNMAKVILITDACRSGKLAGNNYKGKQLTARKLRAVINNQLRLASCREDELAAEGPNWGGGRGVFSYYLLNALTGETDSLKNGTITKSYLDSFMKASFASDKFLRRDKHKQQPVLDGNDFFPLSFIDRSAPRQVAISSKPDEVMVTTAMPAGLSSFKALGQQPIDRFFSYARTDAFDTTLDFGSFKNLATEDIPLKMTEDYISFKQRQLDSLANSGLSFWEIEQLKDNINASITTLNGLKIQLASSKALIKRFNEKFVQVVHEKAQEMINAYLKGDIAEIEKRQYYYSGKRSYSEFLEQVELAKQMVPEENHLAGIIALQKYYLAGLLERLKMETSKNTNELLKNAFAFQYQAIKLQPYAPYISNEIGNLYLFKKNYDSALYYFDQASELSPTWAIPWSNKIKLNLELKNIKKATEAIFIADSLQTNLAYIKTNAGLVMENEGNLLLAESYYLQAIAQNNIHYLPYERLGYIYMQTGEFGKADFYLYEAKKRKESFTINDEMFRTGMSMNINAPDYYPDIDYCQVPKPVDSETYPYLQLLNALTDLRDTAYNKEAGMKLIKETLNANPAMPLAHHYLGKIYFTQGNWQAAEKELMAAIADYKQKDELKEYLYEVLEGTDTINKMNCLAEKLLDNHYDETEDHYMLGQLYENLGFRDEALKHYNQTTTIENSRLLLQASLANYQPPKWSLADLVKVESDTAYLDKKHKESYQSPPFMGGYFKAASLYEKLGEYLNAEQVLLNQMQVILVAGDARQAANHKSNSNYYWHLISKNIEALTYNFYKRMLNLNPLDPDPVWNEKAGLFLYRRLALSFNQVPVKEQHEFYNSILANTGDIESLSLYVIDYFYRSMKRYAYPWIYNRRFQDETIDLNFPGSAEIISIEAPRFEPVQKALELIEKAIKFSVEIHPSRELAEAKADLCLWTGKTDEAITTYKSLVNAMPENGSLRNKLVDNLVVANRFPEAAGQLDSLLQRKQIRGYQRTQLATYQLMSGNVKKAQESLKGYSPVIAYEKNNLMVFYAKKYWLEKNPEKALAVLLDSLPDYKLKSNDFDQISSEENDQAYFRLYSIARNYAILKINKKAFAALQTLLDSSFKYNHVLQADPVWGKLRNTSEWKTLMKKYTFDIDYEQKMVDKINDSPWFQIPLRSFELRGKK